ncbi:MAG: Gfo/Idh/MocA family protein [Acidobacteriota bacterium]
MIRVGVVGVGAMGHHHARIYRQLEGCNLVGIYDVDARRSGQFCKEHDIVAFSTLDALLEVVDAVSVAVPTPDHHLVGMRCLEAGRDLLIEKPMASTLEEADELNHTARGSQLILQVGHVERYNPALEALTEMIVEPRFFEVDRLGSFAPRSLETDVILDLMIHDIDVLHALVDSEVEEVRAVGVPILSDAIDIANARLALSNGCVANLTASRVSANRVRKVRIFQPEAYFSVDYTDQQVHYFQLVRRNGHAQRIAARQLEVKHAEPLARQLSDFINSVRSRQPPRVDGAAGRRALSTALKIRDAVQT